MMRRACCASNRGRSISPACSIAVAHGVLRDLVKPRPLELHFLRAGLQLGEKMKRDRLALAVRIGGEIHGRDRLDGLSQVGERPLLAREHLVGRRVAVFPVDAETLLRKVPDMPEGGQHAEILAEKFFEGLRLGRRFDDHERFSQSRSFPGLRSRAAIIGPVSRVRPFPHRRVEASGKRLHVAARLQIEQDRQQRGRRKHRRLGQIVGRGGLLSPERVEHARRVVGEDFGRYRRPARKTNRGKNLRQDILGSPTEDRSVPEQRVTAFRGLRADRTGNGENVASEVVGEAAP